jgi:CRISPR system Cascade subunit CasE
MAEMAQPYEMHRTLMRAFPNVTDKTSAEARRKLGVLFRADVDEKQDVIKVYVQSLVEPDWSFLDNIANYMYTNAEMPGYEHKDIMPALHKIQKEQVFSFRLRANPTKRVAKDDDPLKGKRVELRREEEQIEWLIRKGQITANGNIGGFDLLVRNVRDSNGAEHLVPRLRICSEGRQKGRKRDVKFATTHFAVLFEGLLRVTDAKSFRETIVRGIGPGKAFGFGLLSIAPVPSAGTSGVP